MTYNVLMGMLNPTHSLTHSLRQWWCNLWKSGFRIPKVSWIGVPVHSPTPNSFFLQFMAPAVLDDIYCWPTLYIMLVGIKSSEGCSHRKDGQLITAHRRAPRFTAVWSPVHIHAALGLVSMYLSSAHTRCPRLSVDVSLQCTYTLPSA